MLPLIKDILDQTHITEFETRATFPYPTQELREGWLKLHSIPEPESLQEPEPLQEEA